MLRMFAWAYVIVAFSLNLISSILVPAAAGGDPFRIGGIRAVDILSVVAIATLAAPATMAMRKEHVARKFPTVAMLAIAIIWLAWAVLPLMRQGDAKSLIAELQFPIYLLSNWCAFAILTLRQSIRLLQVTSYVSLPLLVLGLFYGRGQAGADFAAIAAAVAMIVVGTNYHVLVPSIAVVVATVAAFGSGQRAAIVIAVPLFVIMAITLTSRILRSLKAVTLSSFAAAGMLMLVFWFLSNNPTFTSQISDWLSYTFLRDAQTLAVDSRFTQADAAYAEVLDSPILGHGIGATIQFYDVGVDQTLSSNITHNIALDLALRFGVFVAFFMLGFTVFGLFGALKLSWRTKDIWMATLSFIIVSVLAKGFAESVLFKPRVSFLLAMSAAALITYCSRISSPESAAATHERTINARFVHASTSK